MNLTEIQRETQSPIDTLETEFRVTWSHVAQWLSFTSAFTTDKLNHETFCLLSGLNWWPCNTLMISVFYCLSAHSWVCLHLSRYCEGYFISYQLASQETGTCQLPQVTWPASASSLSYSSIVSHHPSAWRTVQVFYSSW